MKETDIHTPYVRLEEIGKGSYATVHRGINKHTGKLVAIKIISMESSMSNLISEIEIIRNCKCRNIVQFLEHPSSTPFLVVMEYCSGGSVKDAMRRLGRTMNVEQITVILRDVLLGLNYLHANKKIHRDVKAANILLNEDGIAKLGDFGVSEPVDMTNREEMKLVGTRLWLPPEVINHDPNYGTAIDIWSLGITVIEMGDGQPPYNELEHNIAEGEIGNLEKQSASFKEPSKWPEKLVEFVRLCLEKDANRRHSAEDLLKSGIIVDAPSNHVIKQLVAEVRSSKLNQNESSLFKKAEFLREELSVLAGIYKERKEKVSKVDQMKKSYDSLVKEFDSIRRSSLVRFERINESKAQRQVALEEWQRLEREKDSLESHLLSLKKRKFELQGEIDKMRDKIQACNKLKSLESK